MASFETKFQIKPGMEGGVFQCPKDVTLPFPKLPRLSGKGRDYVIVFVENAAAIAKTAERATKLLREDGILWFCYPKKTGKIETDIHRDVGWEPVQELGFRGVRAVSIDETWSGLRFRDTQYVKSKGC